MVCCGGGVSGLRLLCWVVRVLVFAWLGFAVARLLCLFCRLRLLEFEFGG